MSEVIQVHDQFYILATDTADPDRTRVLKSGDSFFVCDRFGDVRNLGIGSAGLFHEGTRFLSRLELRIGTMRPLLLSSTVQADNARFVANLTNPDLDLEDGASFLRDRVHVLRSLVLLDAQLHQELRLRSYERAPVTIDVTLDVGADFRDIFEVRGSPRAARGTLREPEATADGSLVLAYLGLDRVSRRTRVATTPRPSALADGSIRYRLTIHPEEEVVLSVEISCEIDATRPGPRSFGEAAATAHDVLARSAARGGRLHSSNEQFNEWIDRSRADLAMMITSTPFGLYPYAGVPWFCCPFGRDALITAFEMLWLDPDVARGVLRFLADSQATEVEPVRDAEPGKILHESRRGEMARLGEVPFGRYYGSADATPLFVFLASEYWRRTADTTTIDELWPSLRRALEWTRSYGDPDGDGFVEYAARLPTGLRHQGWKDSEDSVSHRDGRLAEGSIALCEIQAYVYAAHAGAATLAEILGFVDQAREMRDHARHLARRFDAVFWCDEIGTYALAIDGEKDLCRVRSSNAGHCLFAGIADARRARSVARVLFDDEGFSGWGVRTLAASERRYNPMSYHNGSVWPHDNALLAAGLGRYRMRTEACRILAALFHASRLLPLHRLPELFCGFPRRPSEGPTLYPVACAPQAWSAGAPFLALAATLGIEVNAAERRVTFVRSQLPDFLDWLEIRDLRVGGATLDMTLHRHREDVGVAVHRRLGDVEVVAVK